MAFTQPFPAPAKMIKLLMIHGYTQSGPLFNMKTKALEKQLKKAFASTGGVELVYPTGPLAIQPADIPNYSGDPTNIKSVPEGLDVYGWWVRRGDAEPYTYEGMETGLGRIAETLQKQGPFDGVLGFSQGGSLAGMVAGLLEEGRKEAFDAAEGQSKKGGMPFPASFNPTMQGPIHPQLRFAISYSGFGATTNPLYAAFYSPKIKTPMLHFLGSVDTIVEEARSLRLVNSCEDRDKEGPDRRVIYHPGGHFIPNAQKPYGDAVIKFVRECMGWDDQGAGVHSTETKSIQNDERAEDMVVPF